MTTLTRIDSNEMREILHKIMEDGEWWFAKDLGPALKQRVMSLAWEDPVFRSRRLRYYITVYDWVNRVAQLLANDLNIKKKMGSYRAASRYWHGTYTVRVTMYSYLDENDYTFWTRNN